MQLPPPGGPRPPGGEPRPHRPRPGAGVGGLALSGETGGVSGAAKPPVEPPALPGRARGAGGRKTARPQGTGPEPAVGARPDDAAVVVVGFGNDVERPAELPGFFASRVRGLGEDVHGARVEDR